jgi:uncharacterized repeat protein (TIGR01451 family)
MYPSLQKAAVALLVVSFGLSSVQAMNTKLLPGHVPKSAAAASPTNPLPPEQRLKLAIGLPLRNTRELTELLRQLYDPNSPLYRQYLTVEEFTARFGPTEQDYQAVTDFARSHNLEIRARHANRMLLDVMGSVADIQMAFHIKLNSYPHPKEARTFFAPDREPELDASLPVLHISGLDNFLLPRPAGLHPTPVDLTGPIRPYGGSGPGGTYRGNDFRGAYARNVTLTGTGQSVGLVQFDGYYASDISAYASSAGVPNVPLVNVFIDGFTGTPGANNIEVALDIEMCMAMAPGLSQIIVYSAGPPSPYTSPNDILNRMATDNIARQLSASWTYPVDATTSQIFQEFAAQGQSYFNASGDAGAYAGAIDPPSDDPFVIVVGGTTLTTTGPGGSWVSETAWNWASTGAGTSATAGGASTDFPIPDWQQGLDMSANQGSTTMRNLPDVAMVADNVYVVANNGQTSTVGGTSVSSPLWAAFTALINQQAAAVGLPPVGFLNPTVYALAQSASYATNFHDTVTGNNTNSGSPDRFYAVAGYDLCTGWGSPIGSNLISTLAPRSNAPVVVTATANIATEGCQPSNGAIDPGETVTVTFGLKNIGGVRTTNLVATLLADDFILAPGPAQAYGALAIGAATVSRSFTFTAQGVCGGPLPVTLHLQDGLLDLGTATFAFTLGKPISAMTQNFDTPAAPSLPTGWTTTTSGASVGWVTTTTLRNTSPNSAFALEVGSPGVTELISPVIPIATAAAQLSFRQNFNTEIDPSIPERAYDGGVLEIQIGSGGFTDILAAGGVFLTNGYRMTLDATNDNPLAGRQVWAGLSGGFIPTSVTLPPAAAGQSIRLKWRFGTDTANGYGGVGWYLDTISLIDGYSCCNSSADLAVGQTVDPSPALLGQNLTYTIFLTNLGPQTAFNVTFTNPLPANASFVFGSPGVAYADGQVLAILGTVPVNGIGTASFTVLPTSLDPLTNVVTLGSVTADPGPINNSVTLVTTVQNLPPPVQITEVSANLTNVAVSFLSATGFSYALEYKNSLEDAVWTPLPGTQSGTGAVLVLQDTNGTVFPTRFYRVNAQ